MTAADELKRDAMKALASYYAKPVIGVVVGVCLLFLADIHGRRSVVKDQKVSAAVDTVVITQQARAVAAETVTVKIREKARVDTLVRVITDTTLVLRETPQSKPDTVVVPHLVVQRIKVDSAVIDALRHQVVVDSSVIRAQANLIRLLTPPRCGWKCGAVIGAGSVLLVRKALR